MPHRQRGFSLIELLIVMVIIAILVLIAVPAIVQYRTNARIAAVEADARNIAASLESAFLVSQQYPALLTQTAPGAALLAGSLRVGVVSRDVELVGYRVVGDTACLTLDHTAVGGSFAMTDTYSPSTPDVFSYTTTGGVQPGSCVSLGFASS